MKKNLITVLCGAACGLALGMTTASATLTPFSSGNVNITVPDGNSAGISSRINVDVSSWANAMDSLTLTLVMSGGNNGDLYASLSHNGVTVVLLNRPGLAGDAAGVGYINAGYNVTLQDGGSGGHIDDAGSYSSSSQISGTYYASQGSTAFEGYNTSNPSGDWVLFVSDLSGGDTSFSRLDSWSLTINAVPEPVNIALGVFAAMMLSVAGIRRLRRAS